MKICIVEKVSLNQHSGMSSVELGLRHGPAGHNIHGSAIIVHSPNYTELFERVNIILKAFNGE